jgi:hypothetical protein
MNLFFVFDEYSDLAPADIVRQQADIIMDALHYPYKARYGGEANRCQWRLQVDWRCT